MSTDPENEFFADGISEDIINALGQIEGLRVAARGSAFFFKGKQVDLREVGQKLQVSSVLEGSVRKAGKRLRITAELVNAEDGYQLWSERYDRELEDIFDIQDEIARTIAERLEVALTGAEPAPLAARATDNIKAYEAYLKGRSLLYKRGRFILDALACFEQAVELDPDYALAWAGLADGRTTLGYFGMAEPHETMPQAKEAATRAVELDDSLAEAHCALAMAALLHDFDVPTARRAFLRARELNPKYPQAAAWYALFVLAWVDGQFDEGIAVMTPIVEQDPLSGYNRAVHAWLLAFSGRYDEGVAEGRSGVELDPGSFFTHFCLQITYFLAGRYPEAVAAGDAALTVSEHPFALYAMSLIYAHWGKPKEARAVHDELMARADRQWVSPTVRACTAANAGLTEEVVTLTTRGIELRDPFLMMAMGMLPRDGAAAPGAPRGRQARRGSPPDRHAVARLAACRFLRSPVSVADGFRPRMPRQWHNQPAISDCSQEDPCAGLAAVCGLECTGFRKPSEGETCLRDSSVSLNRASQHPAPASGLRRHPRRGLRTLWRGGPARRSSTGPPTSSPGSRRRLPWLRHGARRVVRCSSACWRRCCAGFRRSPRRTPKRSAPRPG